VIVAKRGSSLLYRVAVRSMRWAVSVWPERSREWGTAVLGEMGEIAEPRAAVSWAAGGFMLFLRAVLAQFLEWMKLPVGRRVSGSELPSAEDGPQFPKYSRLATAVVLLAVVTLLFLPMGRQAARTVEASWRGYAPSSGDRQDLEALAAKAEKENDSRMLGFVALTYPDDERAKHFADRAVALDPNLLWIYGSRYSYCCGLDTRPTAERVKKLKSYDPENAMVYLVNATVEGEPLIEKNMGVKGGLAREQLREDLAKDSEWRRNMDAALRAPKYDNYYQQRQELMREGWKKTPDLSPAAIATGLWSFSLPSALQIQAYAELRVKQALQAAAGANVRDAESMLGDVTGLGQKMIASRTAPFEQLLGLGLMKRGLEGYKKIYEAQGRTSEANDVVAQLREVETKTKERTHAYLARREGIERGLRRKALVLELTAILSLLLATAIGLSLLWLEISAVREWKSGGWRRRAVCGLVDYGPTALLLTSLVFLWSFRPIAAVFEQYRSGELGQPKVLALFWEFCRLGAASPAQFLGEPYHQWLLATVLLVGILVFVVLHGLMSHGYGTKNT
jgi:hypothetical protein